jgi:hypothetical protein
MLSFTPCACPVSRIDRVQRSVWMRLLFPAHARYGCRTCGHRFLASPAHQAELGVRGLEESSGGRPSA